MTASGNPLHLNFKVTSGPAQNFKLNKEGSSLQILNCEDPTSYLNIESAGALGMGCLWLVCEAEIRYS